MSFKFRYKFLFPLVVFGSLVATSVMSCSKTQLGATSIAGTYAGTTTNSGIIPGTVADTFIISASNSTTGINILEKDQNVTLSATDSNYVITIPLQTVTYAGHKVNMSGGGSVTSPFITISILEQDSTGATAGTLVFQGGT